MNAHSRAKAGCRHGYTNVYADLGYRTPENMLLKAQLASRIAELLAEKGLAQTTAATLLGVPQPKLSKMLRGQSGGFSERKLTIRRSSSGSIRRSRSMSCGVSIPSAVSNVPVCSS